MGAVLEMIMARFSHAVMLIGALALSACGNTFSDAGDADYRTPLKMLIARLSGKETASQLANLTPTQVLALRQALETDGQPIYRVTMADLKYDALMAPYGMNGSVQTWASMFYETVSLRQGMVVATRGFANDIMSAEAPTESQVARGVGQVQRRFFYLDGADQTVSAQYDCTLVAGGPQQITVLGKAYATRTVTEHCTGASGQFFNTYWFDQRQILRQSQQWVAPKTGAVLLQRIVD